MASDSSALSSGMTARRLVMRRYGGSNQVLLRTFSDLLEALELPEAWWAATACPIPGMRCDSEVLARLDADKDGIIHRDDLCAAIRWTAERLTDPESCITESESLALDSIAEPGAMLRDAGALVLKNLKAEQTDTVSLAQIRTHQAVMRPGASNGDGVVPVECFAPELQEIARSILVVVPPETDRSGDPGVGKVCFDGFLAAREAALAWFNKGDELGGWDEAYVARCASIVALEPNVQAWFALSRLAGVDPRRASRIAGPEGEDPPPNDPAAMACLLASLPIALPEADGLLRFERLTPSPAGDTLRAVQSFLGEHLANPGQISAAEWATIASQARAVIDWHIQREQLPGVALGRERLLELDTEAIAPLRIISHDDAEYADEIAAIDVLETLVLYRRWLFPIANNFLNFSKLYALNERALFEHGRLFIGGRELCFAMRVTDRNAHLPLAKASGIRVLYVAVEQDEYAVPVTAGSGNDLIIGRRGVFRRVSGVLVPAKVVHVVENPVSLGEAVAQPFVRIGSLITGRLEKWQSEAGKDLESTVTKAGNEAPPPPADANKQGSSPLLGGSLAFAAIGSSFAFITQQLSQIQPATIVLALLSVVGVILVPTAVLAGIKLYRRNLAALLEANGWAINDRMRLSWAQGRLFTRRPDLPKQARLEIHDEVLTILATSDPTAIKRNRQAIAVMALALLAVLSCLAGCLLYASMPGLAALCTCTGAVLVLAALILAKQQRRERPGLLGIAAVTSVLVIMLGGWMAWRVLDTMFLAGW